MYRKRCELFQRVKPINPQTTNSLMPRQIRQSGFELNRISLGLGLVGTIAVTLGLAFYLNRTGNLTAPSRDELETKNISQHRQTFYPLPPPAQAQSLPSPEPIKPYTPDDAKRDLASFTLDLSRTYTFNDIDKIAKERDSFIIITPVYDKTLVYIVPLSMTKRDKPNPKDLGLEQLIRGINNGEVLQLAGPTIIKGTPERLYLLVQKQIK